MDSSEIENQRNRRFDFLRAIMANRAAGSNEYTQSTVLTALQACITEYIHIVNEHSHEMSETEVLELQAKISSLSEMQTAEHAHGDDVPTLPVLSDSRITKSSGLADDKSFPDDAFGSDSDTDMTDDELHMTDDEDINQVDPEQFEISDDDDEPDFDEMDSDELDEFIGDDDEEEEEEEEEDNLSGSRSVTLTRGRPVDRERLLS